MCESLQNPQQVELLQKVQRLEQMLSLAAAEAWNRRVSP